MAEATAEMITDLVGPELQIPKHGMTLEAAEARLLHEAHISFLPSGIRALLEELINKKTMTIVQIEAAITALADVAKKIAMVEEKSLTAGALTWLRDFNPFQTDGRNGYQGYEGGRRTPIDVPAPHIPEGKITTEPREEMHKKVSVGREDKAQIQEEERIKAEERHIPAKTGFRPSEFEPYDLKTHGPNTEIPELGPHGRFGQEGFHRSFARTGLGSVTAPGTTVLGMGNAGGGNGLDQAAHSLSMSGVRAAAGEAAAVEGIEGLLRGAGKFLAHARL